MSLFGEALPFEDDTATSLIRRVGFPPDKMYAQMPEIYLCPCCSEFSKQEERERLLREARDAKEAERRRLMQLDVFEERARPLPSGDVRRKAYRRIMEEEELAETAPSVPPPPQTIDDLRRAKRDQKVPKLIVTVHCGRNVSAEHNDRISVIVRCGAFEGQTEKVLRGKEVVIPWEELFEFPYINHNEPLEVLVVNDALPEKNDQLIGGLAVPCNVLHDGRHGDQEPLPIMPEDSMQTGYGSCQEGPLGTIVVSWYLRGADDKMDEDTIEQQTLNVPLGCTFVVHNLFQFADHGAKAHKGGVLCVLRDTDDNCSESVLYRPGAQLEPSLSPFHTTEGYYYLPGNPSQVMQLNTERKLGHILICVPKQENSSEEEEELLVIGAVPLEFERLYNKGNAVLLIESKSKEDAIWGEISVEWANKPLDDMDLHPSPMAVQKESLFFTVVRGCNLEHRDGQPVTQGYVSVASGDLEGTTVEAPVTHDSDGKNIINWNQEVRFVDVDPAQNIIEVQMYEKERLVSVGACELEDSDEGVVIVQMYHAASVNEKAGEIVGSYKRLHAPRLVEEGIYRKHRAAEEAAYQGADEEDEEQEEIHRPADLDGSNVDEDEEEEKEEEEDEEEPQATQAPPMTEHAMSINEDLSEEEKEADEAAPHETPQWQRSEQEEQEHEEGEEEAPQQQEYLEEAQSEEPQSQEEFQQDEEQEQESDVDVEEELQPEETEDVEHLTHESSAEVSKEASEHEEDGEELQRPAGALEGTSEQEEEEGGLQRPAEALEGTSEQEEEEGGLQRPAEASEEVSKEASEQEEDGEELQRPAGALEGTSEQEEEEEGLPRPAGALEGTSEQEEEEEGLPRPAEPLEGASEQEASEEVWQPEEEQPEEEAYHGELHRREYGSEEAHQTELGELETEHYHAAAQSADIPTAEAAGAYPATAGSRARRRPSWVASSTKSSGYKQPWYPSGAPETDQHIPFSKTKLSKKNIESIRHLETCKSRIEEESVRRSSTPRRSSTRGLSPSSQ